MKSPTSRQPQRNKTAFGALILILCAIGLLLSAPRSRAQQEPNRQLVQTPSQTGSNVHRIALVIGNGAYTNAPPLRNPPNDARDMTATLKALGFEVTSGINVNQRELKRLIRDFGQKLKAGGSGLFYYAGHGVQSKGRNYLIPVEADIKSEADVEDAAVDVNLLLGYMDDAQNGLNIVILDACRNNPFARSFRSASGGLAQVDAPTGTLIAYATAPGRVASDGTARNGLYTAELLRQMRETGLGIEGVFKRVRANVQRQTNGQQVPWESSSLVGDFYFAAPLLSTTAPNGNKGGEGEEAVNRTALDPVAIELSYWETIKNSNNTEDFKSYLDKYPSGQFASLAKNRIVSLEAAAKPVEPKSATDSSPTELAFWDSIKNSADPEDFKDYLSKYPNGQFQGLAQRRLAVVANTARTQPTTTTTGTTDVSKSTTAPAKPKPLQNQYGIELAYIPPGEFMMGTDNDEANERPAHRVIISKAFYMGRYEVTQGQWLAVMGKNPSYFKGDTNLPAEMVSWKDAQEFIARLNALNDNYIYRLPTEAEWEYACRAGSATVFAFGDSLSSEQANFDGHFPFGGAAKGPYWERTAPVGRYQPNAYGLYDMHGNVWEWVQDWYSRDYYSQSPLTDPQGPPSGGQRVVRGGDWYAKAHSLRSSNRESFSPGDRLAGNGFRVLAVLRTN